MRTLASLDSPIHALVVSPDGSTVVTASNEGIGFLELASGQRHVMPLDDQVCRLAWGPNGLVAGTWSGEVWAVGKTPARLFEAIDDEISGIAVAADGTIAVCGGEPFAVATFGHHGNEEWRGEPYKWPYCVRFSDDDKLLAIATWDGALFVLDAHDLPDELGSIDAANAGGPIFDAQFLPHDRVLVAGASFVRVWDLQAGDYIHSRELTAEALAVAVSPDASCAVVATNDQRLRLLGLPRLDEIGDFAAGNKTTQPLSYFPDYAEFCHVKGPATIRTLAFHPDGQRVFGSTEDHRIIEVKREQFARSVVATRAPTSPQLTLPLNAAPANPVSADAAPATSSASDAASSRMRSATKPAATKPAATKAAATKAAATKSAATKSAATKPAATKSAATKSAATKPAATKSAATKSAATKPAATKSAATKPAATKPAATKPAATKPAATKSAATEPATTKAAATKPAAKASRAKVPAATKPAAKASRAKVPAATKSAAKASRAKVPAARKSTAKKPAGKKPAARKPAPRRR